MNDLVTAVIGGAVSGAVSAWATTRIVLHRSNQRAATAGDHSPSAQATGGAAVNAAGIVGDVAGGNITKLHSGRPDRAELVIFKQKGAHSTELYIRNSGTNQADSPEWHVEGERGGVRVVDSGTPTLPDPMSAGAEVMVALVLYSMSSEVGGQVMAVATWDGVGGQRQRFTLPL